MLSWSFNFVSAWDKDFSLFIDFPRLIPLFRYGAHPPTP